MKPISDLSFLIEEPFEVYLAKAADHLTSSLLKDFRRNPLLYFKRKHGLAVRKDTKDLMIGRATHALVLEGRATFDAQYAVGGPVNPNTGKPFNANSKAYKQWAAAHGKPVLKVDEGTMIVEMNAAVRSHAVAGELLAEGMPEGVVRADYRDVACQIRVDWFNPQHGIIDLKTCNNLTYFESDAKKFGHIHQAAFYQAVVGQAVGNLAEIPVHIIAVEKQEPYRCGVWRLAPDVLKHARKENEQAMERLKRCEETAHWPTGYESVRTFDYL